MIFRLLLMFASVCVITGCSHNNDQPLPKSASAEAPASTKNSAQGGPKKLTAEHLPNPVQVHPKVISGGLPAGEKAFAELQELGVKTIISVDGMKPDVETAAKYGLKYVHLPHGYDGIPEERIQELAKAVRDLEGPVYIHCHHGKHRSPAAASVACVSAGLIPRSEGLLVLDIAGTSPHYRGLFQAAEEASAFENALLDQLQVEFREIADIPPMAEAMVAIGHTHDHLKTIAAAGWQTPPDHPDLDPAHEVLLLREHFTEMLRTEESRQQPVDFQEMLRDSERDAQEMEDILRKWQATANNETPPKVLGQLSGRITANCKACHEKYRDVPLGEK